MRMMIGGSKILAGFARLFFALLIEPAQFVLT